MTSLAALFIACSVYSDHEVLAAVARIHSGGNPLAVRDTAFDASGQEDPLRAFPRHRASAHRSVANILRRGGRPVMGLLPARPQWARAQRMAPAALFDPCPNVRVASAKVANFDKQCAAKARSRTSPSRRRCVLQRYGQAIGLGALHVVIMGHLLSPRSRPSRWAAEVSIAHSPSAAAEDT